MNIHLTDEPQVFTKEVVDRMRFNAIKSSRILQDNGLCGYVFENRARQPIFIVCILKAGHLLKHRDEIVGLLWEM